MPHQHLKLYETISQLFFWPASRKRGINIADTLAAFTVIIASYLLVFPCVFLIIAYELFQAKFAQNQR